MHKSGMFLVLLFLIILQSGIVNGLMNVDIDLGRGDVAIETFNITFRADQPYDSIEYVTSARPLNILYEGQYALKEANTSYIIVFEKNISTGENSLAFSLLYDDLIERTGSRRVFREGFSFPSTDSVSIRLNLPEYFILSREPSATPPPDSIESDGRTIVLEWDFDNPEASIAVFYEDESDNTLIYIIIIIVLAIVIILAYTLYHKKKLTKIVTDTLSEDEKKVVELLKQGITKQKEIASRMNFSKSKMSKVIRKLEEKDLIEKTPYFKTNILKLKKIK